VKRILAIDYGSKRCGLAVTDTLHISVNPLPPCTSVELLARLKAYVAGEPVETIVLGFPTSLQGEDTHSTEAVRKLSETLQQTFPELQIVLWDERFTSKMASRMMAEAGLKRKDRRDKARIDTASAAILLHDYLKYLENKA
jgi:putative holliday junction resolvase